MTETTRLAVTTYPFYAAIYLLICSPYACMYVRCMYVYMYVCKSCVIIVICMYAGIADTADKCRCKTCKEGYMLIKGDGALLSQSVVSLAGGQYLDVPLVLCLTLLVK
jgi:hypothetical protein